MELKNRTHILECALRLFAAHGYEGVGIQRIVEAARVSKPTLYHYFGSKEGLLAALLEEHREPLRQALAGAHDGDLPTTLNAIASAYFQFSNQHPFFCAMQLTMWCTPKDSAPYRQIQPFRQWQEELLEQVFARALSRFAGMQGRTRLYGATFFGMIHTCIGLALAGQIVLDEAAAARAAHQFLHGIFA